MGNDKMAIKNMHEFLLLQVSKILIEHYNTLMGNLLNFLLAFKHELVRLWFQFKIQKQNPHMVTGFKWPMRVAVNSNGRIVVSESNAHSVTIIKGNKRNLIIQMITKTSIFCCKMDDVSLVLVWWSEMLTSLHK